MFSVTFGCVSEVMLVAIFVSIFSNGPHLMLYFISKQMMWVLCKLI